MITRDGVVTILDLSVGPEPGTSPKGGGGGRGKSTSSRPPTPACFIGGGGGGQDDSGDTAASVVFLAWVCGTVEEETRVVETVARLFSWEFISLDSVANFLASSSRFAAASLSSRFSTAFANNPFNKSLPLAF